MDLDTMTNVILNNQYDLNEGKKKNNNYNNKYKKKKRKNSKFRKLLKVILILIILFVIFVILFFKTYLFQKYKELWVQTAMSTMNHQYLATWFLSDEEIEEAFDYHYHLRYLDDIYKQVGLN